MATLPTNRTTANTPTEHVADHNTLHGLWNVLTTAGDILYATGAQAYTRLAKGTAGQVLTMNAGATAPEWAAAPSGTSALLASVAYNPASPSTGTIVSTSSSSLTDVDATNLVVTFIAPASGAVVVKLTAVGIGAPGDSTLQWGLRSGSSEVSGSRRIVSITNAVVVLTHVVKLTGLSGSYTWKWGHAADYATSNPKTYFGGTGGTAYGQAVMEVWSA